MRIFFFLVCCHLALWSGAAGEPRPTRRPDGTFSDHYRHVARGPRHCYGYDRVQTPSLDQLAKQGVRFTQAFTPSPTPTLRMRAYDGAAAKRPRSERLWSSLAASHLTLAETLKKRRLSDRGIYRRRHSDSKALAPVLIAGSSSTTIFPRKVKPSPLGRVERRGMEVVQHAETWLNAHPAGLIRLGAPV